MCGFHFAPFTSLFYGRRTERNQIHFVLEGGPLWQSINISGSPLAMWLEQSLFSSEMELLSGLLERFRQMGQLVRYAHHRLPSNPFVSLDKEPVATGRLLGLDKVTSSPNLVLGLISLSSGRHTQRDPDGSKLRKQVRLQKKNGKSKNGHPIRARNVTIPSRRSLSPVDLLYFFDFACM